MVKKVPDVLKMMAEQLAAKEKAGAGDLPSEMVDVVDADDRVLKQMERSAAERGNVRLRGVQVFIENADGEFLVQWRRHDKVISPRTFTASAAGMVSAGEDYAECAARELAEELGIDVKVKEIGAYQTHEGRLVNGRAYVGRWDGEVSGWEDEADALDMWGVDEAAFMLARFPYLLSPTFRESLKIYLQWKDEQ